jgi:hypothetical protein
MRVGIGRTKVAMKRWGYIGQGKNKICSCGDGKEDIMHMLQCRLSGGLVTRDDLEAYNERARNCVWVWRAGV